MEFVQSNPGTPFIFVLIYLIIFLLFTLLVSTNIFMILKIVQMGRKIKKEEKAD